MTSASDPTPSMIDRATAWRKFVKLLDTYFSEAATTLEQRSEQSSRLANSVSETELHSLVPYFSPRGNSGVNDVLPTIISMHETEAKASAKASKLIGTQLRAELEQLTADIDKSIEDFRGYSASFTNEPSGSGSTSSTGEATKEAYAGNTSTTTADLLNGPLKSQITEYQQAVAAVAARKSPKVDPYILKLSIDKKIAKLSKSQNRLSDSLAYTQDASKEVDAGVVDRLQKILGRYADAFGNQGQATLEGSSSLLSGFLAQPKLYEYSHYLNSSKAPVAFRSKEATQPRPKSQQQSTDVAYADEDSVYSKALRTGELERRTKFLHSYSPGEYVLTPQSLIELKSGLPVWSLDLIGAKLLEDHKAADANQFVLQARQHGSSSGKQHTFVFRAKVAQNWRRELAAVTAGEIPPSLESIAHAQNGTDTVATDPTGVETSRVPEPSFNTGTKNVPVQETVANLQPASAPLTSAASGTTVVPDQTSKSAAPASAVAAAGGAATGDSRQVPDRLDSTDAIPPSSKYNMDLQTPRADDSEPLESFPDLDKNATPIGATGTADSAEPFKEPPSNASLTGVPVAGAAGAATAEAPYFGHDAPANKTTEIPRTLDPAASNPSAYTGRDPNLNPSVGYTGSNLDSSRDTPTAALSSLSTQDPTFQNENNPFATNSHGSTEREFSRTTPYSVKSPLEDSTSKGTFNQDTGFEGSGAGTTDTGLSRNAPFDLDENKLERPITSGYPTQNSGAAEVNTAQQPAIDTVASGAAGLSSREPYEYKESQLPHSVVSVPDPTNQPTIVTTTTTTSGDFSGNPRSRGAYDISEEQLSHPSDRTAAPYGTAAGGSVFGTDTAAAATNHLAPQTQHDSDSEMSEADQDFNGYFDKEDLDEPRIGTLAWQARHDMQVFNKPVGYAAVDDPRPEFSRTADDERDDASTWSYDATHQNALNTLRGDANFKPTDADLPVQTERRLTDTHHKLERPIVDPMRTQADALDDPEQALQRRRSSVNLKGAGNLRRSSSRRATGSYGDEDGLKPLSGMSSQEKSQILSGDSALVFGEGMPNTTSGPKF